MGQMVHASCTCGFDGGTLSIGAGMQDFGSYYLVPAICRKCGAFDVADYFLDPASPCTTCGGPLYFYTEAQPKRKPERTPDLELTDGVADQRQRPSLATESCLCPACGQFTLAFELVGMWD